MNILTASAYILAHKYTFSPALWHPYKNIFYTLKLYQQELDNTNNCI